MESCNMESCKSVYTPVGERKVVEGQARRRLDRISRVWFRWPLEMELPWHIKLKLLEMEFSYLILFWCLGVLYNSIIYLYLLKCIKSCKVILTAWSLGYKPIIIKILMV